MSRKAGAMTPSHFWLAALLLMLSTPVALADDLEKKPAFVEEGEASWYGPGFDGQPTASGEIFDQDDLTAAHPELPLGATAEVTNLENGRSVEVEINDRGPQADGRVIDLSREAAERLDMVENGTAPVRIEASEEDLSEAERQGPNAEAEDAGSGGGENR
jgi:rare lipoprotein A (peptidoglycan hydrolase)